MLLARRGYTTTGIDRSEVGVLAARRAAVARGLRISAVLADTAKYDFGRERWDLIVLLYFPQPMILIERLKAAVRPAVTSWSSGSAGKGRQPARPARNATTQPDASMLCGLARAAHEHDDSNPTGIGTAKAPPARSSPAGAQALAARGSECLDLN